MLNINEVYNADCLEKMKEIDSKSIDMILCDLPYGTTACKWDTIIPFDQLWEQYHRIIKDNGAIVLTASQPFTSLLISSNIKNFKYCWVWEKEKGTNFQQANKMPLKIHEDVCIFYKKSPIYNPQFTFSTPYNHVGGKRNKKPEGLDKGGCATIHPGINNPTGKRYPTTVQRFKNDNLNNRIHYSQKPVALFEYLIKTYTNEGDLVLDNCSGSGTTAIAAINTNRNYILIEKDLEYYNKSKERIEKHIKNNLIVNGK